ncbi:hypothetical protein Nepgr_019718 [Nepenthes gracilis]|uniref:Uncharacterized protein n=1 Tax=Nepenthes gracilis TaxID=150966 RepID=A0AAD3XUD8_NEPGR|nr:hypothetical protein Nepgr_019718 [Nepenthes gracilis]
MKDRARKKHAETASVDCRAEGVIALVESPKAIFANHDWSANIAADCEPVSDWDSNSKPVPVPEAES